MTIAELHYAVRLGLDKTDALNLPSFTIREVDHWLNVAQEHLVNTRYGLTNVYQKGFEQIQKRVDDLRELVKLVEVSVADNLVPMSDLPDYRFLVRIQPYIEKPDCPEQEVTGKQVQHDDLNKHMKDPFHKPDNNNVLYCFREEGIVFYSKYPVTKAKVTYVKMPTRMSYEDNITCELAPHIHQELVDYTVTLMLENIESQRRPINNNE